MGLLQPFLRPTGLTPPEAAPVPPSLSGKGQLPSRSRAGIPGPVPDSALGRDTEVVTHRASLYLASPCLLPPTPNTHSLCSPSGLLIAPSSTQQTFAQLEFRGDAGDKAQPPPAQSSLSGGGESQKHPVIMQGGPCGGLEVTVSHPRVSSLILNLSWSWSLFLEPLAPLRQSAFLQGLPPPGSPPAQAVLTLFESSCSSHSGLTAIS